MENLGSCTEATVDDCSKEERKRKEPRAMNNPHS